MKVKNWRSVRPRIVHDNMINYRIMENPEHPTPFVGPELACLNTIRQISYDQLQPGMISVPHQHSHEEVYLIVKGRGEMLTDGENIKIRDGDVIHIAPNDKHGTINNGDETLEFFTFAAEVPKGSDSN